MNATENIGRAPSFAYLRTSFVLLMIMQVYNLCLTSILIITIITHRAFRTIPNLLTANSSFAIFYYSTLFIIQLGIGWNPNHQIDQGSCVLISYLTVIAADTICYSYLVTATSQCFFNLFYRRKYLLSYAVHWMLIIVSWIISGLLPLLLYLPGKMDRYW